jgi:dihydroxyacetone kinase-like protein
MDNNTQVDVATILNSIAGQLQQNQAQLNNVDGGGTHGQRMSDAFTAAANAAQSVGSNDAGAQLMQAAQAMKEQGQGKAATFYAQGLEQAAKKFEGQAGIGMDDLGPFLQSFLGGVKQNNPAKPGQGTMLDALGPAVTAFTQAQKSGSTEDAMAQALGAAINGTASTAGKQGTVDPGAASVTNILGGIFAALAPQLINMVLSRATQGSAQGSTQVGGIDVGGLIGGLLGGVGASAGTSGQATQSGGQADWVTGLLGGLASASGGNNSSGGVDLGGLLNGLMGNNTQASTQ